MDHLAEYQFQLKRLPIIRPTNDDMKKLCPHLDPAVAVHELRHGSHWVALPPILIDGTFHYMRY